jgi:hypothetical protein
VDGHTPATPTITQVLNAGNNALDVSQIFSATGSTSTTTIDDAEVQIIDGTGKQTTILSNKLTTRGVDSFVTLGGDNADFFGLQYESVANSDFIIQTASSGSVLYKQVGVGADTTQTRINQGYISINDTASPDQSSQLTKSQLELEDNTAFPIEYTSAIQAVQGGWGWIDNATNSRNISVSPFALTINFNDATGTATNNQNIFEVNNQYGQIRCVDSNFGTQIPLNISASSLLFNGSPIGSQNLNSVLSVGNSTGGLDIDFSMSGSIDNVLNINGSAYPPPPPSLGAVMGIGNSASTDLNMAGYSITNVNTINGYSPVVIGLTWGDFTGSNAYNNLPNQAYQVASGAGTTSQYTNLFEAYDNSNYYGRLYYDQLQFYDNNTGTSTSYAKDSINNADSNPFTITAGSGASQPLNLNCSQLYINGNLYTPYNPVPPPLRWAYYQNTGIGFSVGGGSFTNVGVGSSPIVSLGSMTPFGSYTIAIQFSCFATTYDNTASCYLNYNNSSGSWNTNCLYNSNYPCPAVANAGTFPVGATTQFNIQDTLIFVAGSSGELLVDLYFGSSTGFGGIYFWSFSAQVISP